MSQPVLVQGAGSWGTALALVLARNHHQVYLWDIDIDVIREIKSDKCNRKYLPGIKIPANILAVEKIEEIPIKVKKIIIRVRNIIRISKVIKVLIFINVNIFGIVTGVSIGIFCRPGKVGEGGGGVVLLGGGHAYSFKTIIDIK